MQCVNVYAKSSSSQLSYVGLDLHAAAILEHSISRHPKNATNFLLWLLIQHEKKSAAAAALGATARASCSS
jgi:hypothetical protein